MSNTSGSRKFPAINLFYLMPRDVRQTLKRTPRKS